MAGLPCLALLVGWCLCTSSAAAAAHGPLPLGQVRRWAYQIDGLDAKGAVDALAASSYDMLVIEPVRTAKDTALFDTAGMVQKLQASYASDGVHRKRVIAYMNVGQAEAWRWYWAWPQASSWTPGTPRPAGTPAWISEPDPDGWTGNFIVQYWSPEWRSILYDGSGYPLMPSNFVSTLDAILKDGFDGIYMDWIAAATTDSLIQLAEAQGRDAVAEMAQLIADLRAYALARNPEFVIIQQNAPELIDGTFTGNAAASAALKEVVDGIGQEDTWYGGGADAAWDSPQSYGVLQDPDITQQTIAYLKMWRAANKPVFTIDYTVSQAASVYNVSAALGFVPYCSRSGLSKLTTTPPPDSQTTRDGTAGNGTAGNGTAAAAEAPTIKAFAPAANSASGQGANSAPGRGAWAWWASALLAWLLWCGPASMWGCRHHHK